MAWVQRPEKKSAKTSWFFKPSQEFHFEVYAAMSEACLEYREAPELRDGVRRVCVGWREV